MILYLDSSSIVSLYLDETGRAAIVERAIQEADLVSSSSIAYAEVRAAFARASREPKRRPRLDEAGHRQALRDLHRDWRSYARISPSNRLIRLAGDLAESHALKGYDAVHLASALAIRDRVPDTISFSSWDGNLAQAAAAEGFQRAH